MKKLDISEPRVEPSRDQMKVLRALIRKLGREKVAKLAMTLDSNPRPGRSPYWGSPHWDQGHPNADKWNIVWWLEMYRSKNGIDDAVHDLYDLLESKEDQNRLTAKRPGAYQRWAKAVKKLYYSHRDEVLAYERSARLRGASSAKKNPSI